MKPAKIVASCLSTQGEKELSAILVHALLREDRSFHTIQMLEAAFRQKTELQRLQILDGIKPISHVLIAAATRTWLLIHQLHVHKDKYLKLRGGFIKV